MDDLECAHIQALKLIFKLSRNSNAYKSYNRCNTNVLNDLVVLKQPSHCLRKSMNIEFPSPKSEIGRMTFRHRAVIAWNSVPDSIKKSSSLVGR